MFGARLLHSSQDLTLLSSLFTLLTSFSGLSDSKYIFVSSAKRKKFSFLDEQGKSFMYTRNNRGPRTDPCGAPQAILLVDDDYH